MREQIFNTIKGSLYGVAVGDALGAPLEFMSASEIKNKHGYVTEMIGGGWLNVRPGEITDDTQMTLAVAEGISEIPTSPMAAVGRNFISWVDTRPKDIGGTCNASINKARQYLSSDISSEQAKECWHRASEKVALQNGNRSGGNGALMRTVYPGLFYKDLATALQVTRDIACMTHWDAESNEAGEIYTKMIYKIIALADWTKAKEVLIQFEEYLAGTVYFEAIKMENTGRLNPTGYVVDSFKCAIYALYNTVTFEDAVAMAANMGGDADTIAAIVGGLAGALYGYQNIPNRWIVCLDKQDKERLDNVISAAAISRNIHND